MKKLDQQKSPVDAIEVALKQYDAVTKEIARIRQIKINDLAEIEKLLNSARVDDPQVIAIISGLRIKQEIIPSKVKQLDESLFEITEDLNAGYQAAREPINIQRARLFEIYDRDMPVAAKTRCAQLVSALAPNLESYAEEVAKKIVDGSLVSKLLVDLDPDLHLNDDDKIDRARAVVGQYHKLQRVETLFFKDGSLDLDAVAKIKSDSLIK